MNYARVFRFCIALMCALSFPLSAQVKEATEAARLTGRIVDERGRPIAQAPISLHALSGSTVYPRVPYPYTDNDGRFSLELAPAEIELTITDPRCPGNEDFLPGDPPRRRASLGKELFWRLGSTETFN